jgi:hypothetical protein
MPVLCCFPWVWWCPQDVAEAVAAAKAAFPAWSTLTVKRRAAVRPPTCASRPPPPSPPPPTPSSYPPHPQCSLCVHLVPRLRAALLLGAACTLPLLFQYMFKLHELMEAATEELADIVVRVRIWRPLPLERWWW